MWGQWIGTIEGTNKGIVSLCIDRDSPFAGRIVVGDFSPDISSLHAKTTIKQNGDLITGEITDFISFSPQNFPAPQQFLPDTDSLPQKGKFTGKLEGNLL